MIVEARLLGGPAEGEIRAVPDIMREIKVAYHPPLPYGWWDKGPEIAEIAYETHSYLPVRAVVYYEHRGTR